MKLKDNFMQAAKELLNGPEADQPGTEKKEDKPVDKNINSLAEAMHSAAFQQFQPERVQTASSRVYTPISQPDKALEKALEKEPEPVAPAKTEASAPETPETAAAPAKTAASAPAAPAVPVSAPAVDTAAPTVPVSTPEPVPVKGSVSEPTAPFVKPEVPAPVAAPSPVAAPAVDTAAPTVPVSTPEAAPVKGSIPEPAAPSAKPVKEPAFKSIQSAAIKGPAAPTIISEGTVITGKIESEGSVELYGKLKGDLCSKASLRLCGCLEGDAKGGEVKMQGSRMIGNIDAREDVDIDSDSVVIGNIQAENLVLNGKVKGDISVRQSLQLQDKAVLLGNAMAGKIAVNEGAVFQGEVKITSADMDKMFAADL